MSTATIISRTDLARHTRQVVDQVRRGHIFVVESYGEEQVAILDILDYRLLSAVATYHAQAAEKGASPRVPIRDTALAPQGLSDEVVQEAVTLAGGDVQVAWNRAIVAYLEGNISLGRVAQLLGLPRFDLMQRFTRLGLPLQLGAANLEEARAELEALQS